MSRGTLDQSLINVTFTYRTITSYGLTFQLCSVNNIFSGGEIPELEIVAYEKEDIDKLLSFMING